MGSNGRYLMTHKSWHDANVGMHAAWVECEERRSLLVKEDLSFEYHPRAGITSWMAMQLAVGMDRVAGFLENRNSLQHSRTTRSLWE